MHRDPNNFWGRWDRVPLGEGVGDLLETRFSIISVTVPSLIIRGQTTRAQLIKICENNLNPCVPPFKATQDLLK